jgi:hypothetical protein
VAVTISTCASALGGVGDDDVRTLLCGRNQFKSLVTWIERGGGLGRHDRQNLNAFHVLLNVGAVDVAYDRTTVNE